MDKERYEFCWIVDFPMYEIGDESGELEFCHNPFSMPSGGLEVLLKAERGEIDPLTITADQYDLVCNGVELSSGAVRNHDPEIMVKAFELVRLGQEDVKKKFPAMYNAFCYGAPPHAGIAPGVERSVLAVLCDAYDEEVVGQDKNGKDDVRVVLRLHPALAPYKAAILPLSKKLSEPAMEIYSDLCKDFMLDFDETGSIGKRYRREDEIGTPFCITVDFDTVGDGENPGDQCVTVRERDSMEQVRVPISQLKAYLTEKLAY